MTDFYAKCSDPHDGSVAFGITGSSVMRKISPDAARATAHALLAAADEAERPRFSLYRDAQPPRPGTTVRVVDKHGHPDSDRVFTVACVKSKRVRQEQEAFGTAGTVVDKVWLADGTGPFVRQIGFDTYLLCDNGRRGDYRLYLALA